MGSLWHDGMDLRTRWGDRGTTPAGKRDSPGASSFAALGPFVVAFQDGEPLWKTREVHDTGESGGALRGLRNTNRNSQPLTLRRPPTGC